MNVSHDIGCGDLKPSNVSNSSLPMAKRPLLSNPKGFRQVHWSFDGSTHDGEDCLLGHDSNAGFHCFMKHPPTEAKLVDKVSRRHLDENRPKHQCPRESKNHNEQQQQRHHHQQQKTKPRREENPPLEQQISDSSHASEASYHLGWDRDRGWSRGRAVSESDHSLPLDELNTPIVSGLSDSLQEEVAAFDEFGNCSFEYGELNVADELFEPITNNSHDSSHVSNEPPGSVRERGVSNGTKEDARCFSPSFSSTLSSTGDGDFITEAHAEQQQLGDKCHDDISLLEQLTCSPKGARSGSFLAKNSN